MNLPFAPQTGPSIVCTALNAAIDKRLHLSGFRPGHVHRVTRMEATAGGKGLNVARVAQSLGASVTAAGFAGGSNGSWILDKLDQIGLEHRMVPVAGETRVCLNILDDAAGSSTEVLEPGPEISPGEKEQFVAMWRRFCVPGRWLTLSGSLPRGLDDGFYGELIDEARNAGAFVILDSSGAPLAQGACRGPHTVKPNEEEFRRWTGADPRDDDAVRRVAEKLGRDGVQTLIVSLGREGCLAARPDGELWRAVPPAVEAVNTVGSGDAFVAGWSAACSRSMGFADALRLAVAAGAANAMSPGTGQVRAEDVQTLFGRVHVERK